MEVTMKQLSIRNVNPQLAAALEAERRARDISLNETVLDLLRRALGLVDEPYDNGLEALSGSWSDDDFAEFATAVATFNEIDENLWQ